MSDTKKLFFHVSDVLSEAVNGEQTTSAGSSITTSTTANNSVHLKPGDEVEFLIAHNPRNGKYSATKVKRLHSTSSEAQPLNGAQQSQQQSSGSLNVSEQVDAKRPERLITKLKVANIDDKSGKQLILIRQPNNPDGKTKSFSKELKERLPGSLTPLEQNALSNRTASGNENQQVSSLSIIELLMAQQQQTAITTTS